MKTTLIGVIIAILVGAAYSQEKLPGARFEVASIRAVLDAPPGAQMSGFIDHGRATLHNARLRQIIGVAYSVQRSRVEDGPKWLDSNLFEIEARAEAPDATEEQVRAMLQMLLKDRFQLKLHRESRLLASYTLLVARGGPKIQTANETEKSNCAFNIASNIDPPKSEFVCRKTPMPGLVNALSNLLKRPVADQTGLTGNYDFSLAWEGSDSLAAVPDAMDVLGLKLETKKVPTEILIVDSAERPSEN